MPILDCPLTWNHRFNAWDGKTIEALQERIGCDPIIPAELATLFAKTAMGCNPFVQQSRHRRIIELLDHDGFGVQYSLEGIRR